MTKTPNSPAQGRGIAALVMLATLLVIVVNFLAATGFVNDILPNEISDKYPTVITPAAWAFTIWILIYAGLVAFSIHQLRQSQIVKVGTIRVPYLISCVLNCIWISLWHYFHTGMCVVVIILLLACLFWVTARLGPARSFGEATLTTGVFGLYAGWVTVAALVNVVVYLVSSRFELSAAGWDILGILCLAVAAIAAVAVRVVFDNFIYPLPIAWAAAAIGAKQSGNTPIVVASALLCIACLITSGTVVTRLKGSRI